MNVVLWVLVVAGFLSEILTLSNARRTSNNELPDGKIVTSTQRIKHRFLNSSERKENKEVVSTTSKTEISIAFKPAITPTLDSAKTKTVPSTTVKTESTTEADKLSLYLDETPSTTDEDNDYTTEALNSSEQSTTSTDSSVTTESNCAELPKINLTVEIYSLNVTLNWDPPKTSDCEIKYNIYLDDTLKDTTSELSYTIGNLYACNNYKVEVAATYGEIVGDKTTQKITTIPLISNPPEEAVPPTPGKDYINVTWKIDNSDVNKCPILEIFVCCNADDSPNSNNSCATWEDDLVEPITMQASDNHYPMTVAGLSPFTNYTCSAVVGNKAGNSSQKEIKTMTDQDIPPAPGPVVVTNTTPNKFTIEWTEPQEVPGVLTGYIIRMTNNGPLYTQSQGCLRNDTINDIDVGPEITTYIFSHNLSYHLITVAVTATDDAGESLPAITNVTTPSSKPDSVANAKRDSPTYSQNEIYQANVTIKFDPPCNMNGPFKHYEVTYNVRRANFEDYSVIINTTNTTIPITLLPERNYSFEIRVITENFTSEPVSVDPLVSKAGVPLSSNLTSPIVVESNKAYFTLNKNDFDNSNGEIVAWALILLTSGNYNPGYDFWDGTEDDWPEPPSNSCQLTCKMWNPFDASDGPTQTNFTIGILDTKCSSGVCKMPLTDNTDYWLLVRAFTTAAYKDSDLLYFKTEMLDGSNLGLILGLTFGLLALVVFIIFIVFLWRKKRKAVIYEEEKRVTVSSDPAPIPVEKFATYYISTKENYDILKQQFSDLVMQSKKVAGPITYATLTQNTRKNRYTNILPYDETRVKLNIDEDDEISSDYINASYIKGYSGKIEYIATQGPLESTTRDFWKMVLQENVSIIVMLSQFVEQNKEKCFQYFPNNHESTAFGEHLEVKCSTELHFGTYCMRTLQVRKGTEQRHVVHMQFLEWPDFGVPQGTDNMLQFCNVLREKANCEGGLIVVHCSAGVGRTGTLIALDILLQTTDDHRDINIYKTVFDLRKQRINMVQTEKQYIFIHSCVKEYIETPTIPTNDSSGGEIYENMDIIRSSLKKNLIETEIESAF